MENATVVETTEPAVVRTTVRLPAALDERLSSFCERSGAVKNRVIALAVAEYLGDEPVPAPVDRPVFTAEEVATLRDLARRATGPEPA